MGGKVLEYEAKSILNQGIQKGIQKGHLKGQIDTLMSDYTYLIPQQF